MSTKDWQGPLGLARVGVIVAGLWLIVDALTGRVIQKMVLPLLLVMLGLGFLLGYQVGQLRRS